MLGFTCFCFFGTNLGFSKAVILDQRDLGRANKGTGTTLDTIEQVMVFGLIKLTPFGKPVQLLRQQFRRANLLTGTTTDTRLRRISFRHLFPGRGNQAVGGLGDR